MCVYMVREGVCAETYRSDAKVVADGMSCTHFLMSHKRPIAQRGSALVSAAFPNPQSHTHTPLLSLTSQ